MNHRIFLLLLCVLTILSTGCRSKNATTAALPGIAGPMLYELDVSNQLFHDRLLRGFYDGTAGWKWTARQFAVALDVPPPREQPTALGLDFTVPSELTEAVGAATLTARVNRQQVGSKRYDRPGRYYLHLNVPAAATAQTPALVEFELDKAATDPANGRELGIIVVGVSLVHPETAVVDRPAATEQRGKPTYRR